jgi:hypothetical protein
VLSVSLPACLATIGFFIVYRLAEDYLIVPRIIGQAVKVPAVVTVVAALLGRRPARDRGSPRRHPRRSGPATPDPGSALSPP